ncbi:MAG: hypothetical protein HUU50_12940 [Candidatus Brocadiae bacterium]|nr:hypothetical protein [Candidatus Brocadiia bacterium]
MKINKKLIILAIFVLSLAVLSQVSVPEESSQIKNSRLTYSCYFSMKKIGVALLQYADQEGDGLYFPNDLSVLVKKQYLSCESCLFCGCQPEVSYHYFPGLRKDMPHNMAILMEKNAPHSSSRQKGEKTGFCLFLDFSGPYRILEGDDRFLIQDMQKALLVAKENDKEVLLKILDDSLQNERSKSMSLWKIRQLGIPVFSTNIPEYLYAQSPFLSKEAAYAVFPWNEKMASDVLYFSLYDSNYFIRKSAWEKLFSGTSNIGFISPGISKFTANKFLKKK